MREKQLLETKVNYETLKAEFAALEVSYSNDKNDLENAISEKESCQEVINNLENALDNSYAKRAFREQTREAQG